MSVRESENPLSCPRPFSQATTWKFEFFGCLNTGCPVGCDRRPRVARPVRAFWTVPTILSPCGRTSGSPLRRPAWNTPRCRGEGPCSRPRIIARSTVVNHRLVNLNGSEMSLTAATRDLSDVEYDHPPRRSTRRTTAAHFVKFTMKSTPRSTSRNRITGATDTASGLSFAEPNRIPTLNPTTH